MCLQEIFKKHDWGHLKDFNWTMPTRLLSYLVCCSACSMLNRLQCMPKHSCALPSGCLQGSPKAQEDGYPAFGISKLEQIHAAMTHRLRQKLGLAAKSLMEHKGYAVAYKNLKKSISLQGNRYGSTLQACQLQLDPDPGPNENQMTAVLQGQPEGWSAWSRHTCPVPRRHDPGV